MGITSITGDDRKHIVHVMRMDCRDQVIAVSDGDAYIATIIRISPDSVTIRRE